MGIYCVTVDFHSCNKETGDLLRQKIKIPTPLKVWEDMSNQNYFGDLEFSIRLQHKTNINKNRLKGIKIHPRVLSEAGQKKGGRDSSGSNDQESTTEMLLTWFPPSHMWPRENSSQSVHVNSCLCQNGFIIELLRGGSNWRTHASPQTWARPDNWTPKGLCEENHKQSQNSWVVYANSKAINLTERVVYFTLHCLRNELLKLSG